MIGQLNLNGISGKLEPLKGFLCYYIDILLKIDSSFTTQQLFLDAFSIPYCRDRNVHCRGIHANDFEGLFFLNKPSGYNCVKKNIGIFGLHHHIPKYDNHLINEPTCFKSPDNPSSIDVILTNKLRRFHNSNVIETGLSIMKRAPVVIKYRDFKKYNASAFHVEPYYVLRQIKHLANYRLFKPTFIDILNKVAPLKEKLIRANTGPFMNRELSKAFMTRS